MNESNPREPPALALAAEPRRRFPEPLPWQGSDPAGRYLISSWNLEKAEVEDLKKFQARSSFRAGWSCQEEALKEKVLGGQQQAKNNPRTEAESVHSRRLGKKKRKSFMCSEHFEGQRDEDDSQ